MSAGGGERAGVDSFRLLLDALPRAVAIVGHPGGELLYANPGLARIFGTLPAAERGRFAELLLDEAEWQGLLRAVAAEGALREFELQARRPDGSAFWLVVSAAPFVFGGAPALALTAHDIDERKVTAESWRDSMEDLQSIYDSILDGLVIIDLEKYRFLRGNRALARMMGRKEEELSRLTLADLVPPWEWPAAEAILARQEAGEAVSVPRVPCLRADGSVFYADLLAQPIVYRGQRCSIGVLRDTTEQVKAEAALRAQEERFRTALENSHVGYFFVSAEGYWLDVNEAFVRMFGSERREELVGQHFRNLLFDEDVESTEQIFRYLLEGNPIRALDIKVRRRDGVLSYITFSANVVKRDGEVLGAEGFVIDATERRRAEEQLRASEDRLRAIVEAIPIPLVIVREPDGEILYANARLEEMFGKPAEEMVGRLAGEFYCRAEDRDYVVHTLLERGALSNHEVEYRLADGSTFWAVVSARTLLHKGEQAVVAGFYDITERRRAEEAMHQSQQRLELALRGADLGLWDWRLDTGEVRYNNRWAEMLGFTREEIAPTVDAWRSLVHPDDFPRAEDCMNAHIAQRSPLYETELRLRTKSGGWKWVLSRGRVVERDADGRPLRVTGTHLDIDDRRRAEEELRVAKDAAEAASRAKSDFLAKMSHEIRTPIMAMLGGAELLGQDVAGAAPREECVDMVLRNGRHLLALIDDLLNISKLELGQLPLDRRPCSLLDLLDDARAVAVPIYARPDVELRVVRETSVPRLIRTDPTRLRQAIINLLSNALKFTPRGAVTMRVRVAGAAEPEPRLTLVVEDTGPGIPAQDLDRIFEDFAQLELGPGQTLGGVGLGLPVARSIAQQLGGSLTVSSVVGQGSVFTLRATTGPLDDADWLTPEAPSRRPGTRGTREGTLVAVHGQLAGAILLAEDFGDARELMCYALRRAGADVTGVPDGNAALTAVAQADFDLILLDIRMPGLDGLAVATELRRQGCLTPLIALTASVGEEQRERILRAGFDDLWRKPIALAALVSACSAYVPGSGEAGGDAETGSSGAGPSTPAGPVDGGLDLSNPRMVEAVASFAETAAERLVDLEDAVAGGQTDVAREILHQLVGAAGLHGFPELSEEAAAVLARVKSAQPPVQLADLATLHELVDQAHDRARSLTEE